MPAGIPLPPVFGDEPDRLADDTYGRLLQLRTVFLRGRLDGGVASRLVAELLVLDGDADGRSVTLVVNAQGGPLDEVFAVLDTMATMRSPVDTVCLGQATGTAAAVVALGTGTRKATAGARLDLRLADALLEGRAADVRTKAESWLQAHDRLAGLLAERTGRDRDAIAADLERGRPLSAEEAAAAGLVDEVVDKR